MSFLENLRDAQVSNGKPNKKARPNRSGDRKRRCDLSFECLERRQLLATLVWSDAPALPIAQTDAVAVLGADNRVHLLGGDSAAPTTAPQISATGTVWSSGVNIDTQRNDLGAVRSGSAIFLFGGTGNNEGSDETLSYDYFNGDSQDQEKMNWIRYDHGFAADSSGRAYAIGGIGVFDDGEIWSQAERFDPSANTWTAIESLPQALHGMSAIGDGDGNIFVFGGSSTLDDTGIQNTNYRYEIASDSWSSAFSMPVGTRDSAVVMDQFGTIYVLGGMTANGATDTIQAYDPATNAWSSGGTLPEAVYSQAAVLDSESRVIVAGGFDASGTPTVAVHQSQKLDSEASAPAITSTPVVSASIDRPYTYDVDATGNPAPAYSLGTAPDGMTINSLTGVISWQPLVGQLGIQSVTVQASNTAGVVEQPFEINVVADTIAPTAPLNGMIADATETTLTLSWDASFDAVGVDHYEVSTAVYTGPRFGKRWRYTVVDTVPGTSTTSTITGLTPLTGKRFSIQAFDAAGNVSGRSARFLGTTLSAPTLAFRFGSQTTGTVTSPALTPIEIRLSSVANPVPLFSIDTGPATMVIDQNTGVVQWTPTVNDIGVQDVVFRATNSVGSTTLTVSLDIVSDAPQLSVTYFAGPAGQGNALAGTLFNAQINDASNSTSAYTLLSPPNGMTIDLATGLISWTPSGIQGGPHSITVQGANSGGTTDLTFPVQTLFTDAVSNVLVTGTSLAEPTASWVAPVGEGADLVASYTIRGFAKWGVGRTSQTHTVNFTVPASETSVLLTGLVTGKSYALTITGIDASGNPGLANTTTSVVSNPALPQVRWSVTGSFGSQLANPVVVAEQPMQIILTDERPDPSNITLISGPADLTYNPATMAASWTPTANDITVDYAGRHIVTFEATNSVGTTTISIPLFVRFSGTVKNLSATKYGTVAATAWWDAPTDNVNPVANYQVTRHWTWSGRPRSSSWTISGDSTTVNIPLSPTGAVVHKGVTITPIDASGNLGVSSYVAYGQRANNFAPIAVDDQYDATEDTTLTVDYQNEVRKNDIDTDNTPFFNPLMARLVTGPANGTVTLAQTGTFTYIPDANYNGIDSFTYLVNDGKFNSNVATVTINVASVNDTPSALDDDYVVAQDTVLTANVVAGVQANDSDVDGDVLNVSVVVHPVDGSIQLSPDGSFVYTPNAGFTGTDSFTYVANDSFVDSRIATVSITVNATDPPATGTRFYVVDFTGRATFEYDTNGELVETYGLPNANRKPKGVASNADGSLVWTIDKQKRVFIYDDAGAELGRWVPEGLSKPEGIATDGINVWIVDRESDKVFFYADGANRRNGNVAATSSFSLNNRNRNAKGITTDGTNLWVVNNTGNLDRVFKYDLSGTMLGRWTIDSANASPTGITIDPNNVNDIWVVDNSTDSVFQYLTAAARIDGAQPADVVFALDASNLDPQGIADPLPNRDQANELAVLHDPTGNSSDSTTSLPHMFTVDPFDGGVRVSIGVEKPNIPNYRRHTNGSNFSDPQQQKLRLTDVMFANSSTAQNMIDDFQNQVREHDSMLGQNGKDEAPSRIAVSSFDSFADDLDAAFGNELDI